MGRVDVDQILADEVALPHEDVGEGDLQRTAVVPCIRHRTVADEGIVLQPVCVQLMFQTVDTAEEARYHISDEVTSLDGFGVAELQDDVFGEERCEGVGVAVVDAAEQVLHALFHVDLQVFDGY